MNVTPLTVAALPIVIFGGNCRHNCERDVCTRMKKICRPSVALGTLNQHCTECSKTAFTANFEHRNSTVCYTCSNWCSECGASATTTSPCAYDHCHPHSFTQTNQEYGLHDPLKSGLCDDCRNVQRRCVNSRHGCRCNTTYQNNHCPAHHGIPDFEVAFSGTFQNCDACRSQRKVDRKHVSRLKQRQQLLTAQHRPLQGATQRVVPLQGSTSVSHKISWYDARRHLATVVDHLQQHRSDRLPLTSTLMRKLYEEKSLILEINNNFGLSSTVVVQRMFAWLLNGESRITTSTTIKTLPWNDPRR